MLYVIHRGNHPDLSYEGGQENIIHLQADLYESVAWADNNRRRWAFTKRNAAAALRDDRCDLNDLDIIEWEAVQSRQWSGAPREYKQAEFLMEGSFPFSLVEYIGVYSSEVRNRMVKLLHEVDTKPPVEIRSDWYY